ncbi:hypothetical protein Dda_6591 [Drechslerella dactyloides]|uniref:Uncharacterized protein n=1 Tax=Drechslerella dactyloides TaxID=74499 RepID=A0AAD6NHP1_DREDA|nr:hypothetical protein Dda_6591 [Drechslerella dactyloides]
MSAEDEASGANSARDGFSDRQKENRGPPNFLAIRFAWEKRHQEEASLADGGSNDNYGIDNYGIGTQQKLIAIADPEYQGATERYQSSSGTPDSSRPGTSSSGLSFRDDPAHNHRDTPRRDLRRSLFGSRTSLAESIKQAPPILLPNEIPSTLSLPQHKALEPVPGIMSSLITRPTLEPNAMPKQTAFVYVDKDAVISILTTLEYTHPIFSELYLHTQSSLEPGAIRSCEEMSTADFLEGFMNPALDPILTNKLEGQWWSIECGLPNGVIMIHSLQLSTYSHVFIFKFSPVTGVFSKLVPEEVTEMRAFLEENPNDPKVFPKIPATHILNDSQKLRIQLGNGGSLASRSMTNLANLLPVSLSRKIPSTGFASRVQHVGTAVSEGVLAVIRENILPILMNWNRQNFHTAQRLEADSSSCSNISSNPPKRIDENQKPETPQPSQSRRSLFFQNSPRSYLKHPLQMLRQAHSSTVSLASNAPSSSIPDDSEVIKTPTIILTTPERETSILKLSADIPQTVPQMRIKSLWPSIIGKRGTEPPIFVFWKEVFEQLCFGTSMPSNIKAINMDLDTNLSEQVANDLHRLLAVITEMYVEAADGMQLDFIRMKVPPKKNTSTVDLRKFYSAQPVVDLKMIESYSTAPETLTMNQQPAAAKLEEKTSDSKVEEESKGSKRALGTGIRDNLKVPECEHEMAEANIEQSMEPAERFDKQLKLKFGIPELEFSSILLSRDTYIVEAVLAGWFADAAEWIRNNELQWRDALLDREASQSTASETSEPDKRASHLRPPTDPFTFTTTYLNNHNNGYLYD